MLHRHAPVSPAARMSRVLVMPNHVCGTFDHVKRAGCCACCLEPVYEVRQTLDKPGHPLDGHPIRLGAMLEHGTQIELLLSDGSEADVAFCLPCAMNLTPEMYPRLWRLCLDRMEIALGLAGRSDNERLAAMAKFDAVWPMAIVRKRREAEGMLAVDRRG